jgi:hypothetical protein
MRSRVNSSSATAHTAWSNDETDSANDTGNIPDTGCYTTALALVASLRFSVSEHTQHTSL